MGFDEVTAHEDLDDDGLALTIEGASYALIDENATSAGFFAWDSPEEVFVINTEYDVRIIVPNTDPSFPAAETGARTVDENTAGGTAIGAAVAADDGDGDSLTYELGDDSATSGDYNSFSINPTTGQLSVAASTTLNYESAADADGDNIYEMAVSVRDNKDAISVADTVVDDTIAVTITVTNVN